VRYVLDTNVVIAALKALTARRFFERWNRADETRRR
jgi:hypothetical protein